MISCRTLAHLLFAYAEKELLAEHGEMVREHLAKCPQCAAETNHYLMVIDLSRKLPMMPLPADLRQLLLDRLGLLAREQTPGEISSNP